MEIDKVLYKGKRLLIPYHDEMNVVITSDGNNNFDVKSLLNNRTEKYLNCFNITKFLSKTNLTIKAIRANSPEVKVIYQNNEGMGHITLDEEIIDANLDDAIITLKIDENLDMHIHIYSNDEVITVQDVEEEAEHNNQLKEEHKTLKEQWKVLKEENEKLMKDNMDVSKDIENLKKENDDCIAQKEQYEKDMITLKNIFNENKDQKDILEDQFQAELKHYGITLDIFKEYQNENNSKEIEKILQDVNQQLSSVEQLLKEYIEARQKEIDKIHNLIKPS